MTSEALLDWTESVVMAVADEPGAAWPGARDDLAAARRRLKDALTNGDFDRAQARDAAALICDTLMLECEALSHLAGTGRDDSHPRPVLRSAERHRRPVQPPAPGRPRLALLPSPPEVALEDLPPPTGAPVIPLEPEPAEIAETPAANQATFSLIVIATKAAGVVTVGFVLFALFATAFFQGRSQSSLLHRSSAQVLADPAIGLNEAVLPGDSLGQLSKGPGIANANPLVIVGHRVIDGGPFRHLAEVKAGGTITLTRQGSTRSFLVDSVAKQSAGAPLPPGGSLYLVTADPPYADHGRLVVVAHDPAGPLVAPGRPVRLPPFGGSVVEALAGILVLAFVIAGWLLRSLSIPQWPVWARWGSAALAACVTLLGWRLLVGSLPLLL